MKQTSEHIEKRIEVREHLIELFEQTDFAKETPEQIADAVLWVENEDGVVIKADATPAKLQIDGIDYVPVEPLIKEE